MKLGKYSFSSILGASVLAGGIYFTTNTEPKNEGVKILTDTVSQKTNNTISSFGDTKTHGISSEAISPSTSLKTKDSINELLQDSPILKKRIQGTSWYRDYMSGKLDRSIAEKYIIDASSIEEILKQHPGMIYKIQYEVWWERYIQGTTNPSDMLAGNMQAYFEILKTEEDNAELYKKASLSKYWNSGIQYGEDYIVNGQREILTSLYLRLEFLDKNPDIEKRLQEKGFTRNNLFTDDWSKGEGIYAYLNSLQDENK